LSIGRFRYRIILDCVNHAGYTVCMRNGEYELVKAPDGYPGKKYRGRYCYEHHLVWWETTGSIPGDGEIIHHKNGKKRDNRYENLELQDHKEHSRYHTSQRGRLVATIKCPFCGEVFEREARLTHVRKRKVSMTFCSRICIGKFFKRGVKIPKQEKDKIAENSIVSIETKIGG